MSFVHEDPEFQRLLEIVARDAGIAALLVEKDYWVTHTLWAIHRLGLEVWFKGGTSLSKAFGLIQRFSEDLDLMVEAGRVTSLPAVTSWTSTNAGPVARRHEFYSALAAVLQVPHVRLELDATRHDRQARGADYVGHYPGAFAHDLAPPMSPFIRLEVGRARVVPHVPVALTSFVHAHLDRTGMLGQYEDNRPTSVRCVHPLVTLLEKLDAISRRYERSPVAADGFARHYEDAAQVIRAVERLPPIETSVGSLARDMVTSRDVRSTKSQKLAYPN